MGHLNYSKGHEAEKHAAEYLKRLKYKILALNWKTTTCEIDIIAKHKRIIYFVEVKYRTTLNQGSGIDYITAKKLDQMRYAAEVWIQENKWRGDYELSAIEISGPDFLITNFIKAIT